MNITAYEIKMTPGRLAGSLASAPDDWPKFGRAREVDVDWIAHELDSFILLEPISERARGFSEDKGPSCPDETTGWLFAEDWDCTLETAVATELAKGWNVQTLRLLSADYFGRMLAAILTEIHDVDAVPEKAVVESLGLVTK